MIRITIAAMLMACLGGSCRDLPQADGDPAVRLVTRWDRDPAGARQWLLEHTGNDPHRFMEIILASGCFDSWAGHAPAQLAAAVLNFPAEEKPVHLAGVFEKWVVTDADAAGNFIDAHLKPGPARDAAVIALVEGIRDEHLAEAVAWARTIADQGRMYSLLESLATH